MHASRKFILASIVIGFAATASAEWDSFGHHGRVICHQTKIGYLRNKCWPHPFREVDAAQTRSPFTSMTNNGWRLHHTLSHEVFRPHDSILTAVGRNRVHWIATQTPVHRRYVYVLQGATQEETQLRVESVQEALSHVVTDGTAPEVLITSKIPSLASGE